MFQLQLPSIKHKASTSLTFDCQLSKSETASQVKSLQKYRLSSNLHIIHNSCISTHCTYNTQSCLLVCFHACPHTSISCFPVCPKLCTVLVGNIHLGHMMGSECLGLGVLLPSLTAMVDFAAAYLGRVVLKQINSSFMSLCSLIVLCQIRLNSKRRNQQSFGHNFNIRSGTGQLAHTK